jgi:hypothetical protein
MKFLAEYIMRGRWQAAMVASALAFLSLLLPPASLLSSAAIALVTLRRGSHDGAFVMLSACAIGALMSIFLLDNYIFALVYGVVLWFPVWIVAVILRESRRISLVLLLAAIFGAIVVVSVYLFVQNPSGLWSQILTTVIEPMASQLENSEIELQQAISNMSRFMTGLLVTGYISGLLLGLIIGRWWQSVLYNPGGFRQEYLALRAHPVFAIVSVIVLLLAIFGSGILSEVAWNVVIPIFLFYVFIGTAIAHSLIAAMKAKTYLLPVFYVLLFLIPHVLLPVALMGLSDTWLNLRNKISMNTGT